MKSKTSSQLFKTGVQALKKPQPRPLVRRYGTVQNVSPSLLTPHSSVFEDAIASNVTRNTWTKEEIKEIYDTPLMKLAFAAGTVHRRFHNPAAIQMCTLMNIKTGGCSEDCSYCAQSSRYQTGLKASKMVTVDSVLAAARIAKDNGSTRFCMGAAWRDMRGRKTNLKNIKDMVSGVKGMGMECCVTLGMIDAEQAKELKDAGLTAYNHNLDTSREHYPSVITTRTYDERLETIKNVREAGLNVCTGGILGLGEKAQDHVGLIHTVSTLPAHPESFPVNSLVPIKGTPMEKNAPIAFDATLRTIATARIVMPRTIIRLAAGRTTLSEEQQVLCFMAGANAVFTGEKMLTTPCNGWDEDREIFEKWGLRPMESFEVEALRDLVTAAPLEPSETKQQASVVV
ncbi:biotin [Hyphodiscus hymeniophilus]|uniref:biotin synthase n=1 Tax=Hyphodiscus hymeniophilus TaxID=353542 RepID=A0A9P7AW20_9HELO|nr:biotin [Hyphodiscus hymeniophilus]